MAQKSRCCATLITLVALTVAAGCRAEPRDVEGRSPAPPTRPAEKFPPTNSRRPDGRSPDGHQPPSDSQPTVDLEFVQTQTDGLAKLWQPRLEAAGCRAIVASPFVIAGDGEESDLQLYRDSTILPAVRALQANLFQHPLEKPVLILLFQSPTAYRRQSSDWFDQTAVPHFGYYLTSRRVMVMDVTTGLGTLVHELVHALIEPDFPAAPAWFNEGLASLYEQSRFEDGGRSIVGLPNWRLPALQQAIRDDTLRPLKSMMTDDDFRNDRRVGTNYAQARYLLYYLQEKNLLQAYYRAFRDGVTEDPDGTRTLAAVAGVKSVDDLETAWRTWVRNLGTSR